MYLRNYFAKVICRYYYMYIFCLNENYCKKNWIINNNIAIRIAGKVSRYIDASMNRATPTNVGFVQGGSGPNA